MKDSLLAIITPKLFTALTNWLSFSETEIENNRLNGTHLATQCPSDPKYWDKYAWANRPWGYKTFSMLNSAQHEILNAHKYENIKKFSFL